MTIKEKIQADVKQAMLSGDKRTAAALNNVKSALLYAEVEQGKRDDGLSDDEVLQVLAKEAKKRQESIDLYSQGGQQAEAEAEQFEKDLIASYMPDQLSEAEVEAVVVAAIDQVQATSMRDMGQVMAIVKQQAGPAVDGALVANLVKAKLSS